MKQKTLETLLVCLLAFAGMGKTYAHDIEVVNADGVTIYYNFTNDQTELEVTYKENVDYAGKVVIPESVTYEGKSYPVTAIGDDAFYKCISLTEVTIPGSVTTIGDAAFSGCMGLTELTIPGSVTSIGDWAFYYCRSLTTLYSLNTTPPSVYNNSTFDDNHYTTVDLFVPEEALEAYRTADVWKDFQKLQAIPDNGGTDAIDQVRGNVNTKAVTVYNLNGLRVEQPQRGLYIRNGKKVVIK